MFVVSSSDVSISTDTAVTVSSGINKNLILDVTNDSTVNGARIQLYGSNGMDAQCYRSQILGNSAYRIVNVNSDKMLSVSGALMTNGTNVQQYAANGTYAQKWIALKNSDGSCVIQSSLSENMVLDVAGGSTANDANMQPHAANGTNARRWQV